MAHAILIVDDEPSVREALRRVFRGSDWDVATAADAASCLEEYERNRLGGTREITVDVRLVAATHQDLRAAASAGRFREDLYYRLAVFPLHLPSLRERGRDAILALTHQFLAELAPRCGHAQTTFTQDALRRLVEHAWPGNIRELRNTIERVLLVARDEREIGVEHLPVELRPPPAPARPTGRDDGDADLSLAHAERRHIARVLARVGGNRVHAARALGIARATLYAKLHGQAELASPDVPGAAPGISRPASGH